jgi:hypothetical protein
MRPTAGKEWRALLQDFAEARLGPAELFTRAGRLLPAGADASQQLLELLAESEFELQPPASREPFIRRIEEFASGAISYDELDLWTFVLWQTEVLSPYAPPASDSELALFQAVLAYISAWEDEELRPDGAGYAEFVRLLQDEPDPRRCAQRLEARFGGE